MSLKGKPQTQEHVTNRLASRGPYGPMKEETKAKLAAVERTPEWREKTRQARLRQENVADPSVTAKKWWAELKADPIRYDEYINKLSRPAWNKGKHWGDETKQKLSAHFKGRSNSALIGRKYSAEHKEKLAAAKRGKKLSPEHRDKLAAVLRAAQQNRKPESFPRGEKHHNYGKPAPKGSGIGKGSYCLKGHWVRSTWERGVADWLFQRNIEYEYEPEIFDLGDGIRYRPDFYLPLFDRWIECKGWMTPQAAEKISRFRRTHSLQIIDRRWWKQYTNGCDWIPDMYKTVGSI